MADLKTLHAEIQKAAAEKLKRQQLIECFTAENLNSRPTKKQHEFFAALNLPVKYRYFDGGNQSSKTSSCVRDLTWFVQEIHPYFTERPSYKRCHSCKSLNFTATLQMGGDEEKVIVEGKDIDPEQLTGAEVFHCRDCDNYWKDWGDTPLGLIVAGQDSRNNELNLWPRIKSLLLDGSDETIWKPKRNGGSLQCVTNTKTGNTIIFMTHGYSIEEARAATQGYTVMYVWVDELPYLEFMEELQRRVDRYFGYFTSSFTAKDPKKANAAIRRLISRQIDSGIAIKFKMRRRDNPQLAGAAEFDKKKLAGLSEERRRVIDEGGWMESTSSVYGFDYDTMTVDSLPQDYSKHWPHMEIVDPAMINKMGYLLMTLDENSGIWYTVKAEYIDHEWAPSRLVMEVDKMSQGYNVMWWASDTEQFFIKEARERFPHKHYWIPYKKTSRKKELIKNLQQALTDGWFKILREHINLIDEIEECKYNDAGEKIIAATKYHLLDCAQYFVDKRPTTFVKVETKSFYQQCKEATAKMREAKETKAESTTYILANKTRSLFSRRRRRR